MVYLLFTYRNPEIWRKDCQTRLFLKNDIFRKNDIFLYGKGLQCHGVLCFIPPMPQRPPMPQDRLRQNPNRMGKYFTVTFFHYTHSMIPELGYRKVHMKGRIPIPRHTSGKYSTTPLTYSICCQNSHLLV